PRPARPLLVPAIVPPPQCARCRYTTLFRSQVEAQRIGHAQLGEAAGQAVLAAQIASVGSEIEPTVVHQTEARHIAVMMHVEPGRSEEHTSELQSRENLVCRLLLEKKKTPGD